MTMNKSLDLDKTVYELCSEYPEVKDIMVSVGFAGITTKAAMMTAGRVMTIPKGASMLGIPMEKIISAFRNAGFDIAGEKSRSDELKEYIGRLNSGEDLEAVRKDFKEKFSEVEASEIMQAEQELIRSGMPIDEVQKLCDVHSALFHGATREERIANAEKAVSDSISDKLLAAAGKSKVSELISISGHPLELFHYENDKILELITAIRNGFDFGGDVSDEFRSLSAISIHYAKKGDLLYPLLKTRYGISGPSDVMWSVDDEIRDEIRKLMKEKVSSDGWSERLHKVLDRAEEMIYKEENILFPICAENFSDEEWRQIYRDGKGYDKCLVDEVPIWAEAEEENSSVMKAAEGEVVFPSGHMTVPQLTALLNTLPLEITFVDENNINRYFNEGWKLFKRPFSALDREVFSCHPPKIEPMVRSIISSFRNGEKDSFQIWMEKQGEPVLVSYLAVRDKSGNYVGTAEVVQPMGFAKEHFAK